MKKIVFVILSVSIHSVSFAQVKGNDVTTPLHLLQPDYKIPYGAPAIDSVKKILQEQGLAEFSLPIGLMVGARDKIVFVK